MAVLLRKKRDTDGNADVDIRPEYSVSPDDDLYGSPRSWTGASLRRDPSPGLRAKEEPPVRAIQRPYPRRYDAHTRDRDIPYGSPYYGMTDESSSTMTRFGMQTILSIALLMGSLLIAHSTQPFAHTAQQMIRGAFVPDFTGVDLPPAVARAFGSVSSSGTATVVTSMPVISVVLPLHGTIENQFSVVSPEITIVGRPGSSVVAAADGLVVSEGENQAYGHYVTIDHAGLGQTFYASLRQVSVPLHAYVVTGQTIGYLPATSGKLTFGYIRNGTYKNPESLLKLAHQ